MSWRALLSAAVAVAGVCLLIARGDGYQCYIIALVGLTAIVGIGLNILLGLSGQISLGHVAFYAIGAYTVGVLTANLNWSFWLALPLAGVFAGLAGIVLAIPVLRVRGPYLAMATIAFGFVVQQGAAEWKGLTGGWNGLMNIPAPRLFAFEFDVREIALLVLGLTILALVCFARLSASPWGKAMRAVRDAEVASLSIGPAPNAAPSAKTREWVFSQRSSRSCMPRERQRPRATGVESTPTSRSPCGCSTNFRPTAFANPRPRQSESTAVHPVAQQSAGFPSITYRKGMFAVKAMIAPVDDRIAHPRGIDGWRAGLSVHQCANQSFQIASSPPKTETRNVARSSVSLARSSVGVPRNCSPHLSVVKSSAVTALLFQYKPRGNH